VINEDHQNAEQNNFFCQQSKKNLMQEINPYKELNRIQSTTTINININESNQIQSKKAHYHQELYIA
jgi:hypothetical protein